MRLLKERLFALTFILIATAQLGFAQKEVDVLASAAVNDTTAAKLVEKEDVETIKPEVKNKLTSREYAFEKGNMSYRFKWGARIQTRFDSWTYQNSDKENGSKLYFRRIRFKSDGHLFTPKLQYKIEVDLLNPNMLDAVIKWNFAKNFSVFAGQTKLRGNRERVISSQNLQLVDRSLLNRQFTLDRDVGVWLTHKAQVKDVVIRTILSVSKGEGRSILKDDREPIESGLDYTARLEVLPFGTFANKGDYTGGDLFHEPAPKFSLGVSYDYNDNSIKSRGHMGSVLTSSADLQTWIADFMFKYQGFSWMSEYAYRTASSNVGPGGETPPANIEDFYLGNAFNTQIGYMLPHNFEVAGRYTIVSPLYDNPQMTEYTVGLSKYIVGHKIKVQTDYSIMKQAPDVTRNVYRIQFEMSL